MKLSQATLRDPIPGSGSSTRMLAADKGHDLTFEAGLLHVRINGVLWLVPANNVLHMRAADAPTKK